MAPTRAAPPPPPAQAQHVADNEPGCLCYELSVSDSDPDSIVIFERCAAPGAPRAAAFLRARACPSPAACRATAALLRPAQAPTPAHTHALPSPAPPPCRSYTSKAYLEEVHWQSGPFHAFRAAVQAAGIEWRDKSVAKYVEADVGFM